MTFRSKVLARTSSSLEKPLYLDILANLTTSGRVFLTEMVKRHICRLRPFIGTYNQVSMTFRSKLPARTSSSLEKPLFSDILTNLTTSGRVFLTKMVKRQKYDGQTDRQTDRQTDGHPKPIGPKPFGLGPNNAFHIHITSLVVTIWRFLYMNAYN